jgi:hypothetical protein
MPTDLPRPKRKRPRPRQNLAIAVPRHPILSGLLNAFMIGTVLLLLALVLLQQKRWADGTPGTVADAFLQRAHAALIGDEHGSTLAN